MKIAAFIGVFPKISESWFVEQTIPLIALGADVRIFAFKRGGEADMSEKIRAAGLMDRVTYLDAPQLFFLRLLYAPPLLLNVALIKPSALWRILGTLKRARSLEYLFWVAPLIGKIESCDIVHCHFGMVANKFLIIKDVLGLTQPFVTTFYGQDSSKYIQSKGPQVYDRLKKECAMTLTMTNEMTEHFVRIGFPALRVRTHYTGVSPESYVFTEHSYDSARVFNMIFVGRFVDKKGIPDVLHAIELVTKQHKNIMLHIVGGGGTPEFHANIVRITHELGIGPYVRFYGMKPHVEMLDMLKDMDLMVQLSKTAPDGDTDDLPFVLLEAGESGLSALTTRHVGIPDAIRDGETGFLVPEGDYRAAAEKIVYLIEHPERVREMSLAVHKFVDTTFGLARLNKQLFELYSSFI